MKTRLGASLALATLAFVTPPASLRAQASPPVAAEAPLRTAEELDQLLGPIALYPDALVALILPAATAPVDLVLAARYLKDGGDPNATGARAWDESVKSLAHYPEVVKWMDENIEWTKQVGDAFLRQPADVMKAIQRLRERARAAGALATTPQQIVGYDSGVITIVPAQPDVIYVPRYEPDIVYVTQQAYYPYTRPFVSFGVGFTVGPWLTHDCDWRGHRVWAVNRHWNWREHRDWRHPVFPGQPGYAATPHRRPWTPPPNALRPSSPVAWRGREIPRPAPIADSPVQTSAARVPAAPSISMTPSTRRDRDSGGRRPVAAAVHDSPQPAPAQTPQAAAPRINLRPRPEPAAGERHPGSSSAVAAHHRSPSAPAAAPAQAFANTPERSFPFNTAPSTPVVAPITGPVVSAMAPAPAPRPRISMQPAAAHVAPPPTHSPPRISMSAPAPAPAAPPPQAHRAPQPQPQTQPAQPPPSREDRDNNRRKVEQ